MSWPVQTIDSEQSAGAALKLLATSPGFTCL
jgi:hypothetical protein